MGAGGDIIEYRGVAQPGSVPAWGAGGREFESRRPDQEIKALHFMYFRGASSFGQVSDSFSDKQKNET
jgi:hypothetical protein